MEQSTRSLSLLGVALLLLWLNVAGATQLFYLGQKIPDIRRPWSSNQYRQLVEALKKVNQSQAHAMPRRSGEFTGPIYQRMVNVQNLHAQLNIYRPLESRQNEARESLFQLKELMALYFDLKAAKQPYAAEALGLMSYSLNQQTVLFTLTTEFWMTLSPNEQSNPVRLKGLAQTKAAAALLTQSALDYLSFTQQFGPTELAVYSAELSKALPRLFVHLSDEARRKLLQRINDIGQNHSNPSVRTNVQSMQPVLLVLESDMQKQLSLRTGSRAEKRTTQPLSLTPPESDLPF
ncbi:hypothetical protein [Pseudomonas sp. EL_65y_Pfl2_R95]|uniref:hypothetical protein n=1 Tax=Pseudomonas sp. EL_65y_Pfl2_R95 TaxID=3088698 RepID=UPI00404081BE